MAQPEKKKKRCRRALPTKVEKLMLDRQRGQRLLNSHTRIYIAQDFGDQTAKMRKNASLVAEYLSSHFPCLVLSSLERLPEDKRIRICTHPDMLVRNPSMPSVCLIRTDKILSEAAQQELEDAYDALQASPVRFPQALMDQNRSTTPVIRLGTWTPYSKSPVVTRDARDVASGGLQKSSAIPAIDHLLIVVKTYIEAMLYQ
ncbi:hypothetical protein K435DRAFT_875002 [Dendrothele bispora CBS 962.96]|uniref:Uncharacterized protein n=1 Tax=Dendrothele bispora (strain CBS 962.96) TaxID=1314807 RepID=A0A4V4HBM0_DENBC|nr:hypothetical protein K435DRAFT_875002 [Dendrothele bispora CBS 962.96]